MTISRLTMADVADRFRRSGAWGVVALAAQAPAGAAPAAHRRLRSAESAALASRRRTKVATLRFYPMDAECSARRTARISPSPRFPLSLPPVVIDIEPKVGAKDVDPGLREIRVTFSKKMKDKSWSWTEGNVYAVPKLDGKIHYEHDQRTCVMPVKLEPGKTYVLGINSERFRNFKDVEGHPRIAVLLVFHTRRDQVTEQRVPSRFGERLETPLHELLISVNECQVQRDGDPPTSAWSAARRPPSVGSIDPGNDRPRASPDDIRRWRPRRPRRSPRSSTRCWFRELLVGLLSRSPSRDRGQDAVIGQVECGVDVRIADRRQRASLARICGPVLARLRSGWPAARRPGDRPEWLDDSRSTKSSCGLTSSFSMKQRRPRRRRPVRSE